MPIGYSHSDTLQQMELPSIGSKQPVYPADLSDWAPQPIPLIRPPSPRVETLPTHDQHPIDPRGIKRKPYEMEDGNMIDGVDFDEQYMPYPQPIMPMSTTGMPPYPGDQTASPIGIEYPQPVLMRGNATLSEQQENDSRKKAAAAAAVDKEPLRPAVPPPDGIECCIQCATKER